MLSNIIFRILLLVLVSTSSVPAQLPTHTETVKVTVQDTVTIQKTVYDTIQVVKATELERLIEATREVNWIAVFIPAVVTIVGVLLTLRFAQRRMKKDQEANLEAQRELIGAQVRVDTYKRILDCISTYVGATAELQRITMNVNDQLGACFRLGIGTPTYTATELVDYYRKVDINPVTDLMMSFFFIIGTEATNAIMDADDGLKASFKEFYSDVVFFLPDINDKKQKVQSESLQKLIKQDDKMDQANRNHMEEIKRLFDKYIHQCELNHQSVNELRKTAYESLLEDLFKEILQSAEGSNTN